MSEKTGEGGGFRVVDRRNFTADGSRIAGSPENAEAPREPVAPPSPAPAEPRRSGASAPPRPSARALEDDGNPSGFETLVSYLSTTAMFQLGLLPGPSGERIPPDLPNAHRTLDLLEVLQEKTQGNLMDEEIKLLEDVLYDLRLTFVELQNRPASRPK